MSFSAYVRHSLLAGSGLGVGLLVLGNTGDKLFAIQVIAFFLATWYLLGGKTRNPQGDKTERPTAFPAAKLEYILLGFSLLSLFFITEYERPVYFFLFMFAFFAVLVYEAQNSATSTLVFGIKLVLALTLLDLAFAFLYPGFVGIDPYRDMSITQYIVNHGGGLPHDFGVLVWYNFSPMAPLVYAVGNTITSLNPRDTELLFGFAFSALPVLMVGSLTSRLLGDPFKTQTSMVVMSLAPFYWQFATSPIPESLAMTFLLSAILLSLMSGSTTRHLGLGLLSVSAIMTHGGMAILLLGILGLWYLVTRSRSLLYITLTGVLEFVLYSAFAVSQGAPYGLATIGSFIQEILTPSGNYLTSTLSFSRGGILISVFKSITANAWEVSLISLAASGLVYFLATKEKHKPFLIMITLVGGLLFFSALLATFFVVQTAAVRYLGLLSIPLISITATAGLGVLRSKKRNGQKVIVTGLILALVVGGVFNVSVSPDFWQQLGQTSYAGTRLGASTSLTQFAGQSYLNRFDPNMSVTSNMLLNQISISPHIAYSSSSYFPTGFYGVGSQIDLAGEPLVYLVSERAAEQAFAIAYPSSTLSSNIAGPVYDTVYSNFETYSAVIPS